MREHCAFQIQVQVQVYSKIQKLSKKERLAGLQVARANLGRPDLQLFKDKINIIIQLLQAKTEQMEFRGGREITSNAHTHKRKKKPKQKKQNKKKPLYFLLVYAKVYSWTVHNYTLQEKQG